MSTQNVPLRSQPGRLSRWAMWAATAAAIFALTAAVDGWNATAPAQVDRPQSQFGGLWQLDREESESLQEKLESQPRSDIPLVQPPGTSAGGAQAATPLRLLQRPPISLQIEPQDDAIVLSEGGRPLSVLVLGDPAQAKTSNLPKAPHVQARWNGNRLVAAQTIPTGAIVSREYRVEGRGEDEKLVIRNRVEGNGQGPLEVKQVYRRAEDEGTGGSSGPLPPATPPITEPPTPPKKDKP